MGASHVAGLSEVAATAGSDTVYVGIPGWVATKDNLADAARKLGSLVPTEKDVIVIDLFSNSAYMGTDDSGLPCCAVKSFSDSWYHVVLDLQATPKSVFEKIISDAAPILNVVVACKTVLVSPIPRYISGKCCTDTKHLKNWGKESLVSETHRAGEMDGLAITACAVIGHSTLLNIFKVFGTDILSCLGSGPLVSPRLLWWFKTCCSLGMTTTARTNGCDWRAWSQRFPAGNCQLPIAN